MPQTTQTKKRRYTPEELEEIRAYYDRKKLLDEVYKVSLVDFARSHGIQLEDGDSKSYHVPHSGGLYIFKAGKGYVWFTEPEPPYKRDIIGFAREYFGARDETAAIEMILGCRALPTYSVSPKFVDKPKGPIVVPDRVPDRAPNNNQALAYLVNVRGIDREIALKMIEQGRVYQSMTYRVDKDTGERKGPYQNICFVGFDEQGEIRSGAMRSMSAKYRFRQDFENNDKSYGFSMPGTSHRLYEFEAPIDAMSHATLLKLQGVDWQRDHRIAEGCLSDRALERYLKLHPEIDEIIWCFDNDADGVDKDGRPHNHGQIAAKRYREKYAKKYRTRIDTPAENDVNADLLVFRGWAKPTEKPAPPAEGPQPAPRRPSVTASRPAPTVPADRSVGGAPEQDEDEWDGFEP